MDKIRNLEQDIDPGSHEGFATQVYNYLWPRATYLSLARYYGHELINISGMTVDNLRLGNNYKLVQKWPMRVLSPKKIGHRSKSDTTRSCEMATR
jgi:hypothetical protein